MYDQYMAKPTARVQAVIDRFVAELTDIAREEAASVLLGGLGGLGAGKGSKALPKTNGHRGKRTAEDLDALKTKFLAAVKKRPGLRIEQLNKELGLSTGELALPVRQLVADKAVKTVGQKRATTYFLPGAKAAKGSKGKKSK